MKIENGGIFMMDSEKIGKFLAELRVGNNFTQKEVADQLNIHETSVSKWERGISIPDVYYLGLLATLYEVTEHEILNGERNFKKRKFDEEHYNKTLEVKNLSKSFGKRKILDDISLTIYEGEIVGLIGPNGAGKTTLIKSILQLYNIDSGIVQICGFSTDDHLEEALSKTGSMIENPDLYFNLSGRKNLDVVSLMNHLKDKKYIDEVIQIVGLQDRIDDKVKKYSLGMRQRLGLAAALIKKPKLLILDEPTNGLDPYGMKELRQILKKISERENMSIFISSHILSEIENICDRVVIIQDGKLVSDFGIEEIKYKHISLEDKFFEKTKNIKREGAISENN